MEPNFGTLEFATLVTDDSESNSQRSGGHADNGNSTNTDQDISAIATTAAPTTVLASRGTLQFFSELFDRCKVIDRNGILQLKTKVTTTWINFISFFFIVLTL